jgi:hypothetical protein
MKKNVDITYKERRKNLYGSPYPLKESLGWVFRNVFGLSKKNKAILDNKKVLKPEKTVINENIKPKYCIGFVGDIMDMKGYKLTIDKSVRDFFSDADYLVGNFEATITNKIASMTCQKHSPDIIQVLSGLFDAEKTYLSVANNHTGDFHKEIFLESINLLKNAGFHVFGYENISYINLNPDIRIITGSRWSNCQCEFLPGLEKPIDAAITKNIQFNILFPHWGYELELYPRQETINQGINFLTEQNIDAIIGHHSHCPQPVTIEVDKVKEKAPSKLIAYSLGDFCVGLTMKLYQYGILLKIWVGPSLKGDKFEIHAIDWSYNRCKKSNENEFCVEKIDKFFGTE